MVSVVGLGDPSHPGNTLFLCCRRNGRKGVGEVDGMEMERWEEGPRIRKHVQGIRDTVQSPRCSSAGHLDCEQLCQER